MHESPEADRAASAPAHRDPRRGGAGAALLSRAMLAAGMCLLLASAWRGAQSPYLWSRLRPVPAAPSAAGTAGGLLVVYQARDCASYASFIQRWAAVRARGEFEVTGVPLDGDNPAGWARRALEDLAPGYPVRPELARPALRMLAAHEHLRTPAAVVLDAHGKPRVVLGGSTDPRMALRARDVVLAYRSLMEASHPQ